MVGELLSHYKILAHLGEGGMGAVYKARDVRLERLVAIKILRPDQLRDEIRKLRFIQEAKSASSLNHPNIVTIYEIAEVNGADLTAMEFVQGKTLDQLVPGHGISLTEFFRYAIPMASALTAAHQAGIIHRDIKPGNVMVATNGAVKVLDFGLAKLMEQEECGSSAVTKTARAHTEEGKIVGTAAYMSPEQAQGRPVDARSDIFSLGAVFYEMLSGRRAFSGENWMSTLSLILQHDPKPLTQFDSRIPRELERVVMRCLRKDPERRFQHMADLKVALEELKEESDSGQLALAPGPRPKTRGRKALTMAAGFALLVAVGLGLWIMLRSKRSPTETALRPVPLTSYPGYQMYPAFSPDGNQVAFAWRKEAEGPFHIYIKLIGAGDALRLTNDSVSDLYPAWSPDGRWIAFVREGPAKTNLMLIPALGGSEREIAEVGDAALAWSRDGKWLVCSDHVPRRDSPLSLFLLSPETGEKRQLTSAPAFLGLGDSSPAFSPDAQTVAFARGTGKPDGDVYTLALSPDLKPLGDPHPVTTDAHAHTPVWTPEGNHLRIIHWRERK